MKHILLGTALLFIGTNPILAQEYDEVIPEWDCNTELSPDYDTMCYNTIVSVGTRLGTTKIDSLTSPVSIISEADIQARGQSYIADLLRTTPGLAVSQSGSNGNVTQIRLRGSEANHTLVLIDGIEVSNPNTGEFDFAGLRGEDVVRIEVLRGEQSALYGSDAIGGVINIITRAGATQERYRVSVEGGTYNTLEGQISTVIPLGGAALSINGNAFTTDGYDISGLGGEKDGSESRSLNLGLNNVDFGRLVMSAKVSTSNLRSEFDSDGNFDGQLEDSLGAENEITTQTARLDGRFSLAGFDHLITGAYTDTSIESGVSVNSGDRAKLNWAAKKLWGKHSATVLAETEDESFSAFGGPGAGNNQEQSISNQAVAGDYRFDNDTVTLTASARQDFNDRFDDKATWRVGAGYGFRWDGRVRASIGTGIKNPSMTELFGFFPASFTGNPDLKPEESLGYNIGYDQNLIDGAITLSVDYFRSDLENEIFTAFNPDFTSTARNRDFDSRREGVELAGRWDVSERINMQASVTFLDAEENSVDEIRRPDFLASGTVTVRPIDQLSLTASVDHTGEQLDLNFATFPAATETLDAYTLVGLNAAYDVNDVMTLTLRGENLLDEDYQEVFGYASQGRRVLVGLSADFE